MNIEKFFPFVAYIVFIFSCNACVSAVNVEINCGSDADSVWFPVLAVAPAPILILLPSVYMFFYPLYLLSTTLFW